MNLTQAVTLVTGANRGLGKALVEALVEAGAPRVYASARDVSLLPASKDANRIVPVSLDITEGDQVADAASRARDTTLLINNAGVLPRGRATAVTEIDLREAIEVNLIGTWRMARAFAPVIAANGGGTIVNVLTLLSLHNEPAFAAYCAAKAASWAMTQSLRSDLARSNIRVVACFPGGIDTDMLSGVPATKARPEDVAAAILAGVTRGDPEIFPDPVSARFGPARLPS